MNAFTSLLMICLLIGAAFWLGRARARRFAVSGHKLNSLPHYYGARTALWCALPALATVLLWLAFGGALIERWLAPEIAGAAEAVGGNAGLAWNQVYNIASGAVAADGQSAELARVAGHYREVAASASVMALVLALALGIAGGGYALRQIEPDFRARARIEGAFRRGLLACACIAILTTAGIIASVLFESLRFFSYVSPIEFLFGLEWSPQTALRADQQGSSGSFGAVPLFLGTLMIAGIALLLAVPTGLMIAIYLGEYASRRARSVIKPLLEVLAGIPTVVYGFFAALTVAPLIQDFGTWSGLTNLLVVSSESALAAGLVMGVMIIPFVSSLSDDVITAVPQSLRDGALALGSTRSEVIKQVVFPAALPGIVGSILLAASRAIGETMIVVMAAGLAANLTANPFDAVTTVTVQIVTLLVGDQEFDSPKTLAAFALGLMLFVVTLALNYYALYIVRKYREQYE